MNLGEAAFLEQAALDFLGRQLLVAFKDNAAHLHLRLLVDAEVEDDLVVARHVVTLGDFYLGILVAFLVEVFLGQNLGAVQHVGSHLTALDDAKARLHLLTVRLLQTVIVDFADSGTGGQMDTEVDFGTHDGVGSNGHLREESMLPVALDSLCDFRSWNGDGLSDAQS